MSDPAPPGPPTVAVLAPLFEITVEKGEDGIWTATVEAPAYPEAGILGVGRHHDADRALVSAKLAAFQELAARAVAGDNPGRLPDSLFTITRGTPP